MASRTELQNKLVSILGLNNVYFQPPTGFTLKYPCIVYKLDSIKSNYAGNYPYRLTNRYSVTYMDTRSPKQDIINNLLMMKNSSFNTQFISENIYNTVIHVYF